MEEVEVKIKFASRKAAEHFMHFLDGHGEQVYWDWMSEQEQEDSDEITAIKLKYNFKNLEIDTQLGRL